MGGDDHLDEGELVGVEHHEGVGTEAVQALSPEAVQAWYEAALLAVVQLPSDLFGQDDGRDVDTTAAPTISPIVGLRRSSGRQR